MIRSVREDEMSDRLNNIFDESLTRISWRRLSEMMRECVSILSALRNSRPIPSLFDISDLSTLPRSESMMDIPEAALFFRSESIIPRFWQSCVVIPLLLFPDASVFLIRESKMFFASMPFPVLDFACVLFTSPFFELLIVTPFPLLPLNDERSMLNISRSSKNPPSWPLPVN